MVTTILANVAEMGHVLTLAPEVQAKLQSICLADLSNGGRGIRNQLEAHLINPLARALFEQDSLSGSFRVDGLESGTTTTLKLVSA
jgi:ATP-dependent Clp protease ATP-binding subunit ClpA